MTDLNYQTGQGASALDQQQDQDRLDGYAVVSGYGVSAGTGLEVDVAAGEALFGTDSAANPTLVSSGATQTVSLTSADATDPRKDVIYIDGNGDANKKTGVARPALPDGATQFDTFQPEPYSMHDIEGVVLAEVWVGAGATSLASGDIRDRRQSATATHEKLIAETLTSGSTSHGNNPAETITDSSTPKDLSFSGSEDRDIHDKTEVSISNSSGASANEDITVTLYDGTDSTGTQIASETQSISLADGASTTATFIASDEALDNGDYFVEVTQSGTALTIDSTTEYTKGAQHTISQTATGKLDVTNQDGVTEASVDPISGRTHLKAVDTDDIDIGSTPKERPVISNADKTIDVPTDYSTIQEAVNQIPIILRHNYTISIADGDYSGEEVRIPSVIAENHPDATTTGVLQISGNTTTPANVTVDSVFANEAVGKRFVIEGIQFEGAHPDSDGLSSLQLTGGDAVWSVSDVNFNDSKAEADRCITVYGGKEKLGGSISLGTSYATCIVVKNQGTLIDQTRAGGGDITGSGSSALINVQSGEATLDRGTSAFDWEALRTTRGSIEVYDNDNLNDGNVFEGVKPGADGITRYTNSRMTSEQNALVSVAGNAYETIFSYNVAVDVEGGYVIGGAVGNVRATWDDGTTSIVAHGNAGKDQAGNIVSMTRIPSLKGVQQLEFENASSSSQTYGWEVLRS